MKTIHKVVLALVSSFAHGTSNPAPQGNRALEKMDALTQAIRQARSKKTATLKPRRNGLCSRK